MDVGRIDEVVQLDTAELWEVTNRDLFPHNWHVHDVQFQVLDIDGAALGPELAGWKDTIYLEPRRVYRIMMRFEDHADDTTPYMMHCHLLLHEDEGLMSQFVVSANASVRDETDAGWGGRAPSLRGGLAPRMHRSASTTDGAPVVRRRRRRGIAAGGHRGAGARTMVASRRRDLQRR